MATATIITIPGSPGEIAKNRSRVAYRGGGPRCGLCGKPKGAPFIATGKLPKAVRTSLQDQAFAARSRRRAGMVMVGCLAYWPGQWQTSRAPGRPRGDVDAPVSNLLDALSGVLYDDDAQVAVLVAVNAKAAPGRERIEASVVPLSPTLLEHLERELGLPFTSAALSTGEQTSLVP